MSDELCDGQLGKQLCLESLPTGILGIRYICELWSKFYSCVEMYDQA